MTLAQAERLVPGDTVFVARHDGVDGRRFRKITREQHRRRLLSQIVRISFEDGPDAAVSTCYLTFGQARSVVIKSLVARRRVIERKHHIETAEHLNKMRKIIESVYESSRERIIALEKILGDSESKVSSPERS